jgi:hypothetical protein
VDRYEWTRRARRNNSASHAGSGFACWYELFCRPFPKQWRRSATPACGNRCSYSQSRVPSSFPLRSSVPYDKSGSESSRRRRCAQAYARCGRSSSSCLLSRDSIGFSSKVRPGSRAHPGEWHHPQGSIQDIPRAGRPVCTKTPPRSLSAARRCDTRRTYRPGDPLKSEPD